MAVYHREARAAVTDVLIPRGAISGSRYRTTVNLSAARVTPV